MVHTSRRTPVGAAELISCNWLPLPHKVRMMKCIPCSMGTSNLNVLECVTVKICTLFSDPFLAIYNKKKNPISNAIHWHPFNSQLYKTFLVLLDYKSDKFIFKLRSSQSFTFILEYLLSMHSCTRPRCYSQPELVIKLTLSLMFSSTVLVQPS